MPPPHNHKIKGIMKTTSAPMSSVLALFFALLCCSVFAISIQARRNPEECTASCGEITQIRYPFRLPTSPAGCGEPDYQLTCENNRTLLNFHGGRYLVRNISYHNNHIRLVDVNLADGRQCRLPSRTLTQEETLSDGRYGILIDYRYVAFLRCPANNITTHRTYARVDCLSGNNTNVFLNHTDDIYYPAPPSCRVVNRVPTLPVAVDGAYDYESLSALMAEGFDMGWSVECRDCQRGGGDCRFDQNNRNKYKRCNNEAENSRRDARNVILFFVGIIGGGILVLVAIIVLIYKCVIKRRTGRSVAKPIENQAQTQNQQ